MILTEVRHVKLLTIICRTVQSILLLVYVTHAEMQGGGQQDDTASKATANSIAFDEERPRDSSVDCLAVVSRRGCDSRISIWKYSGAQERAALTENCKDGKTSSSLRLVRVVVEQPSDLRECQLQQSR